MTTEQYTEKLERDLIESFLKNFHEKIGYYPMVIPRSDLEAKPLNVLTLEELESYFRPFLPKKVFGKTVSLSSKARVRELVEYRQIFCSIARNLGFSLKSIGKYLGNRDHTTVIHSLRAFSDLMETNPLYRDKYNSIINKIKEDGKYSNSSVVVSDDKVQSES